MKGNIEFLHMKQENRHKILREAEKRGVIFGDYYEIVNRLLSAIFSYQLAIGRQSSWLNFCQTITEIEIQHMRLFYQQQKRAHPYSLEANQLVVTAEILAIVRKISQVHPFPFPTVYQEDLLESEKVPRFPSAPGILLNEGGRVHGYPLLNGKIYAMAAPNKASASKVVESLNVEVILALCGLLKMGQQADG